MNIASRCTGTAGLNESQYETRVVSAGDLVRIHRNGERGWPFHIAVDAKFAGTDIFFTAPFDVTIREKHIAAAEMSGDVIGSRRNFVPSIQQVCGALG